ncbi:hypothetical protein QO009_004097 [Brevibacillus aydinogluensis]|nr:hypothetical protein [Brevibacillus aydinogluensis]
MDDLRPLSKRLNEKDIMQQLEFKVNQAKKQADKQVQFLSIEKLKVEKKEFIKLLPKERLRKRITQRSLRVTTRKLQVYSPNS